MKMIKVGEGEFPSKLLEIVRDCLSSMYDSLGEDWFFLEGGICSNLEIMFEELNSHCSKEYLEELGILEALEWLDSISLHIDVLLVEVFRELNLDPVYPVPFGALHREEKSLIYSLTTDKWSGVHLEHRLLLIDMCCNLINSLLEFNNE